VERSKSKSSESQGEDEGAGGDEGDEDGARKKRSIKPLWTPTEGTRIALQTFKKVVDSYLALQVPWSDSN